MVANCLSCPAIVSELNSVVLGIDYAAVATAQMQDADCRASRTASRLFPFTIQGSEQHLFCDIPTGHPRPLVPLVFQCQVFNTIHGLVHSGQKSVVKLVTQKFIWHGLKDKLANGPKNAWLANILKFKHIHVHPCLG